MFTMDIAQSDDTDRLLRDLDMLKDEVVEAADEPVRAPDLTLSDLYDLGFGVGVPRGFFAARGYCPREGHHAPPAQ